jgi:uncharacterized membrane protein
VLVVLALAGLGVSLYLAAFQIGLVGRVWDPLFDGGSRLVLTSGVSRLLPVPDALLGATVYAVDLVLGIGLAVGVGRRSLVASALAAVATAGAVAGIGLAILQPIVARTFCTLCLASTGISIGLAVGAIGEARASQRHPQEVRS